MQKPKPQSKQAPFCTTFLHEFFLSFPTPFEPFWNNSFNENQHEPEVKRKLNTVLEKENTRWTMRVKNGVFLANEKQENFSKRNLLGSNHLLQQTKLNKTEN
jgi:hypothetical protein